VHAPLLSSPDFVSPSKLSFHDFFSNATDRFNAQDQSGNGLLEATLRLVDRSARTEQIMKACVEMEVANTLDASTMFRRSNMSLRVLRLHLRKAGSRFLVDAFRQLVVKFKDEVDSKRCEACIRPKMESIHWEHFVLCRVTFADNGVLSCLHKANI